MKALISAAGALALLAVADVAAAQTASAAPAPAVCQSDVPLAATAERVTFKSRGREIESLLFRPTGRPNGAGVVLLHGSRGLHEDLPRLEAQVGQLASRGYHVLMPNYYDASRQDPRTNPLVFDRWQEASDNALTYLSRVEGVSADRLGVWGYSLGGRLAVDGALDGGLAKAVVAVATGGQVGRGDEPVPILVIAGDHDPDVRLVTIREWEKLLSDRGVPVSVETVNTDRHLFEGQTWCQVFDHTRTFFDSRLLAPAGGA